MKKTMILVLLFLVGCRFASTNTISQPIQAFEISEQCLHICWLGINPGVTSVEDAEAILKASNQIEHNTIASSEDGIRVMWFTGKAKKSYSRVGLTYKSGLVQTIDFDVLSNFTVKDFIVLLGEPNEITIQVEQVLHGWTGYYTLYYSSSRTMIYVLSGRPDGPNPDDFIDWISLNAQFDRTDLPPGQAGDYENRQPWLGYGHIKDYLPGQDLPSGPFPALGP